MSARRVIIERPHKKCRVTIHTARPGVIIGKKGADIETLRKKLANDDRQRTAPEHRRGPQAGTGRRPGCGKHRPAAGASCLVPSRDEAQRCRTPCAWVRLASGSTSRAVLAAPRSPGPNGTAKAACRCTPCVPTSTTPIAEATTPYGIIGIKVWIFKGEIMEHDPQARDRKAAEAQDGPSPRGPNPRGPNPRGPRRDAR